MVVPLTFRVRENKIFNKQITNTCNVNMCLPWMDGSRLQIIISPFFICSLSIIYAPKRNFTCVESYIIFAEDKWWLIIKRICLSNYTLMQSLVCWQWGCMKSHAREVIFLINYLIKGWLKLTFGNHDIKGKCLCKSRSKYSRHRLEMCIQHLWGH